MKKVLAFNLLISLVILFSCGRLQKKAKEITDKTIDNSLNDARPENFSIRSIVEDFQGDSSITEIKGIQVNSFLYVEYCVYKATRKRVLEGVNKIVPEKVNDYSSDSLCSLTTKETFYSSVALPQEKNEDTKFFWRFEKLKNYTVYSCIKAPFSHYIIFDTKSDTVYHRIAEIRD